MNECVAVQPKPASNNGTDVTSRSAGVRVLLVSDDIQTVDTLCHVMEQMAMHVDVCSDIASASRKLCHSKFEALVVDLKDEAQTLELIRKPRTMTSHKALVVLAVLNNSHQMPSAFRAGASFSLVKPFQQSILMHTLKAAYPLMVRERRRSYRCPLQIPVRVSSSARDNFAANSINISEGGMALASPVIPHVGERLTVNMSLPGTESTARINWRGLLG